MGFYKDVDLEIREAIEAGVSYNSIVHRYADIIGLDHVYGIIEEYDDLEQEEYNA